MSAADIDAVYANVWVVRVAAGHDVAADGRGGYEEHEDRGEHYRRDLYVLCARGFLRFLLGGEGRLFLCLAPRLSSLLFLFGSLLLFLDARRFFSSAAWSFSAFSSASSRSRRCARVSVPGSFSEPSGVKLLFLSVKSLTSLVHLLLVKLGEKLLLALGQTDLVCRAVRVLYPRGIVYAAAGLRLKHDADKRV